MCHDVGDCLAQQKRGVSNDFTEKFIGSSEKAVFGAAVGEVSDKGVSVFETYQSAGPFGHAKGSGAFRQRPAWRV